MIDPYPFARRVLFSLDAETAHEVTLNGLVAASRLGLLPLASGACFGAVPVCPDAPIELMGLSFPNRVGLAAGVDKAGRCVDAFAALGFGHVEVGTVTPRPQPGNPRPRLFRLPRHRAIINRMGFNNPGTEGLLRNLASSRRHFPGVLGINIGKNFDTPNDRAIEDYLACFQSVYGVADYVTANLSSPNTKGLRDLQNEKVCHELIRALQGKREVLREEYGGKLVPLVIKIAPDLDDEAIRGLGNVFSETAIDGVIATNTTVDRSAVPGDPAAGEAGGLSGAPLAARSSAVIRLLRDAMDPAIPIIGAGGILSRDDATEKLEAGASLVQIYTGLVYQGPSLVRELASL